MGYNVLVFLHVLGALGFFAALAIEAVALRGLRREPAPALGLFTAASRIGMISMAVLLAAGIALMATVWHHQPWIAAAFLGIAIIALLAVTARRFAGRSRAALTAALVVRVAVAVGIVALMTAKPDRAGSTLILSAAVLCGAVASVPGLRRS